MKIGRSVAATLSCGLLLLLTACGSRAPVPEPTDREAALERFRSQEVDWAPCDPSIFPEVLLEPLQTLGDRLECATLLTPLDWEAPEREEINLGILRVRAGDEAARKGAIFTNPGGPGGDGLLLGALLGLVFANNGGADLGFETAAPELLGQVSDAYDVIGFSPRGVGGSFRLYCGTNRGVEPPDFYTDRSTENVQALLDVGRLVAEACRNTPLSKYINTEQTVRDMDLVRTVMGDEKLNFLGYSYGSWLGAWYAKRFPQSAGNIVLDANTDFTTTFEEIFNNFVRGFERAFREVALPFAARNNAVFGLGSSADEVYEVYDDLPRDLKAVLVQGSVSIFASLYSSRAVPDVAISLIAARGVSAALEAFGEPLTFDNYDAFEAELEALTYAEDALIDEIAREVALIIAQDYLFYLDFLAGGPYSVELLPGGAVGTAVTCNDSPWPQGSEHYVQRGNESHQNYPLLGGNLTAEPCGFWGEPTARVPETPSALPPILMVQTGFDAATPSEGALRAFESLPNAALVYIENEMSHGAFPYNTECVDAKVAAYLLDGTLPETRVSNCDALPLPGETQVYPPGGVPSPETASVSAQALLQPVSRNPLYTLLHDEVRRNAADFFGRGQGSPWSR